MATPGPSSSGVPSALLPLDSSSEGCCEIAHAREDEVVGVGDREIAAGVEEWNAVRDVRVAGPDGELASQGHDFPGLGVGASEAFLDAKVRESLDLSARDLRLPTAAARVSPGSGVPDALIAEPGSQRSSGSTRAGADGRCSSIPGCPPDGMVENMRRLGIAPGDVEVIVLSHGHWDHVTGMEGLVKALGRARLPVTIHPEFWNRRRICFPGLEPAELPATSRSALEEMGFSIVEDRRPSFVLDGAALVTGEVDRTTTFETGFQGHEALRDGRWQPDASILDDQALIVSLGERGLVILSGCGHAGIVNTARYARKLTGNDKIAAIIGGFHLSGPMFERIIEPTVDALAELSPSLLVPAHCTGWRAVHRIATRFPDAFVMSTVGTTITL